MQTICSVSAHRTQRKRNLDLLAELFTPANPISSSKASSAQGYTDFPALLKTSLLITDMANKSMIIPLVTECTQWSRSEPQSYSELRFTSLQSAASLYNKLTPTTVPVDRKWTAENVSFGVTIVLAHLPCKQWTIYTCHCQLFWSRALSALTEGFMWGKKNVKEI